MTDLDQFKETFITECFELLEEMEEKLLSFDSGEIDLDEVNAIFRCAHSIKGGAGAFGFNSLVNFTHILEALLDAMREEKIVPSEDVVDALLKSVDIVSQLVSAAQSGNTLPDDHGADLAATLQGIVNSSGDVPIAINNPVEEIAVPSSSSQGEVGFFDITFVPKRTLFVSGNEPLLLVRELKRLGDVTIEINIDAIPFLPEMDYEECYLSWKIELTTNKDIEAIKEVFEFVEDECDLEIEEFGAICMPVVDTGPDLSEEDEFGGIFLDVLDISDSVEGSIENKTKVVTTPAPAASPPPKDTAVKKAVSKSKSPAVSSIRVDIEKVDTLVNMVGELVITQAMIMQQTKDLPDDKFHDLIQGVEEFSRLTRELQESVMSVRMQPVKSIFARMPRLVRDLSRQLGKDINIEMRGENTEIDKTVIEQLGDPLTHMIRNSVDHGVESPEERIASGKSAQGTIILSADNSGGRIIIEISDDGNGINRERVLAKAIEKGLVSENAQMTNEEIDNIIFMPGFSTAEQVTDVSGRGVGMDVVRRNIADLGGTIEILNTPGKGSRFVVSLPLTLAILDGMIIRLGKEKYIIPINNILESISPKEDEIKSVSDGSDVLNVRGDFVPILYLFKIFGVRELLEDSDKTIIVLVENGRDKFGLVVDEIIGQQQVVIKSIEENSDPVEGVSGATILGDGNVSLILDIETLQRMSDVTRPEMVAA